MAIKIPYKIMKTSMIYQAMNLKVEKRSEKKNAKRIKKFIDFLSARLLFALIFF